MKTSNVLSFEEQKRLFERFSANTLESLDTLYYYILDENLPLSLKIISQQKYEENAENYNGRQEITEDLLFQWFDISEIIESLNDLSDEELTYISSPIIRAISKIDPTGKNLAITPKLLEFEKVQQEVLTKRVTPISNGMLPKDVKNFFKKFSLVGLEHFDEILDYTHHERIDDIRRVKNEALGIKHKKYTNNSTTTISSVDHFKLTNLKAAFSSLTDRELDFFHELVEDATLFLDSVQEYESEYKAINEEFDSREFPYKQVSELLDEIEKEQGSRSITKKKTS